MNRYCIHFAILSCTFACFLSPFSVSQAKDTLGVNETFVLYNGDFLESSDQRFRLSIISTANWTYFLGIQYVYKDQSINIWAANNFDKPASKDPAYLTMYADGKLRVDDKFWNMLIFVNEEQPVMINSTTATLLDNGNLVLKGPGGNTVWQSFDHPANAWVQGMKVGFFDLNTKNPRPSLLKSLQTFNEPNSTLGIDPNSTKELIVMQSGVVYWRSGMWDGIKFSSLDFSEKYDVTFSYFSNENEMYFTWNSTDPYAVLFFSSTANITVVPGDFSGNQTFAVCDEIDGTKGKDQSLGCTNPCGGGDGFNEMLGELDVWDEYTYGDKPLYACKLKCRLSCNCYAYSYISYNEGGWGCKISRSRIAKFNPSNTQTVYVRDILHLNKRSNSTASSPELSPGPSSARVPSPPSRSHIPPNSRALGPPSVVSPRKKLSKSWKLVLCVGSSSAFMFVIIFLCLFCNRKRKKFDDAGSRRIKDAGKLDLRDKRDDESPFISFPNIEMATNQFSDENKLGEGGFGPVYKGKLQDGQEIAVKRLNIMSGYGIEQFKNEVTVISKLQHRNLVKLLGYCIHREERILIYEYLPNKSLDSFVFDDSKRTILNWERRLHIIDGIAQGLLYLHKYSRLKIIHRDLKASNILLDNDLNPKISDFGTARIFEDNESRASTRKVVGTYGYMSPEYAMNGIISVKSDVYSFGVLMLEIISGKKNTSFTDSDDHLNLIGYVWDLWNKGNLSDIADPGLGETISVHEILKYVQVGLLCVQENAADRPTMSDVVSMLKTDSSMVLPAPNQPAFSAIMGPLSNGKFVQIPKSCSVNTVTITEFEGR